MQELTDTPADRGESDTPDNVYTRPGYLLVVTLGAVFVAEAVVMLVLRSLPRMGVYAEAFADALLLSAMIFPLLYLTFLRPMRRLLARYRQTLTEVRTLRGMLPICARCKKVRLPDGDDYDQESWQNIETYVERHSEAEFTHGFCPDCYREWRAQVGLGPSSEPGLPGSRPV